MNPQTLTSTLSSLRKAGSVFGVIFSRRSEVLFSDAPFVPERLSSMAEVLDDIAFYFQKENRNADQLAFGYDGGNLLIVFDEVYRIIVLHSIQDEVDFVAKAARAFIKDYQMSLFAQDLKKGRTIKEAQAAALQSEIPHPEEKEEEERGEELRPVTQRIALKAEQAVDPTEPINPQLLVNRMASESSSSYADEHVPEIEEDQAVETPDETEAPMTATLAEAVEEEADASEVALNREITAPILAPVQPESTLPPPRKPRIRR